MGGTRWMSADRTTRLRERMKAVAGLGLLGVLVCPLLAGYLIWQVAVAALRGKERK
jgi:hypothetical protein